MPFLVGIFGIAFAFYWFVMRTKNAAHIATDLMDVANDVRLAARRFGFKRRSDLHPVESIEDPHMAIAGIAVAFLELDDYPTQEQRQALLIQIQTKLGLDQNAATELTILGRWFMTECGGAQPAIARLSRKLYKLGGAKQMEPVLAIVQQVLIVGHGEINGKQRDALDDVRRAFRLQ
jgi:hypothetical protein